MFGLGLLLGRALGRGGRGGEGNYVYDIPNEIKKKEKKRKDSIIAKVDFMRKVLVYQTSFSVGLTLSRAKIEEVFFSTRNEIDISL